MFRRREYIDTGSHPLKDLQVLEWPGVQVLLAPRTEGWRPSLHYDMHGYVEVDAVPVSGTFPGYHPRTIRLSLHSVELDFRFWQKCRIEAESRGSEYHDIGGSGSPGLYPSETMVQFFAPHSVQDPQGSGSVKLWYPFKATVPCTMFHLTSYEADRFFECTARVWYTPDFVPLETQSGAAAPVSIAGPPSRTSRAYMSPKACSHTLRSYKYPEPPAKPPPCVPFRHCRVLR